MQKPVLHRLKDHSGSLALLVAPDQASWQYGLDSPDFFQRHVPKITQAKRSHAKATDKRSYVIRWIAPDGRKH
jgi:hypothetical protein